MYVVTIVSRDNASQTYTGLPGPAANAQTEALQKFREQHAGREVKETFVMPEADYFDIHDCRDVEGRGCCEICGRVMPGSWLDRHLYGDD